MIMGSMDSMGGSIAVRNTEDGAEVLLRVPLVK
jgi:hypothetical protein